MTAFFALLWLITLILIPVAFFAPRFATRGLIKSPQKASLLYIVLMISFFFMVGLTAPTEPIAPQVADEKIEVEKEAITKEVGTPSPEPSIIPSPKPNKTPIVTASPKPKKTPQPTKSPKPTKPQGGEILSPALSTKSAEIKE